MTSMPSNRWSKLLAEAMETMEEETGNDRIPTASAREWIAEWARENRRRQHALLLTTAHRAKGLEFDHVVILDSNWQHRNQHEAEEQRRLYYVAMTRARHTLTLMNMGGGNPFLRPLVGHEAVLVREPRGTPKRHSRNCWRFAGDWAFGTSICRSPAGPAETKCPTLSQSCSPATHSPSIRPPGPGVSELLEVSWWAGCPDGASRQ